VVTKNQTRTKTMTLKILIPRKHENIKTRNPILSACQENIAFKALIGYKKASTEKEEAC
jgi:hypothetical protein